MNIPENGELRFEPLAEAESSIFITGDLIPRVQAEERLIAGNFTDVFGNILPYINQAGVAITNLECAVTKGGEPIYKFGPNLRTDPAVVPTLVNAGFDVFALANNHSKDFGGDAFIETMNHITQAGGRYVGGGANLAEASAPLRIKAGTLKLSIFNTSMHQPCDCTLTAPGSNPLNPPGLAAAVAAEKSRCDFVLVIVHDGKEQLPFPSRRIRENYRAFIDAGASAVIAHHPHCTQGLERYHGGFIAYSLGNFLFPPRNPAEVPPSWFISCALLLKIRQHKVIGVKIIPHRIDSDARLSEMQGAERQDFFEHLAGLSRISADDAECDRYYNVLANRHTYYQENIRELLKRNVEGDTQSQEALRLMFGANHYLSTEEHWDVLKALTEVRFHKEIPPEPADLDYYLFKA